MQVPTLDDKGFIIADSHAIIQYLTTGSNLTSLDPHVLARINQAMYFDFELFRVMGEICVIFSIIVYKNYQSSQTLFIDMFLDPIIL